MSAPSASSSSPGDQGSHHVSRQLKPLSCISCRQRKIKCNKVDPCLPCQKSGLQCVFPRRTRVPREKLKGSKTRDQELLQRISRLESLVSKVGAAKDARTTKTKEEPSPATSAEPFKNDTPPMPTRSNTSESDAHSDRLDNQYISFIKKQESGIHVYHSGDFWSNLSDEVDGLRQLLEDDSDDDNDEPTPGSGSSEANSSLPASNFMFSDTFQPMLKIEEAYPSEAHRAILVRLYFANVHPICRIIHQPTAEAHMFNIPALLDPHTGRFKYRSMEAVVFAMYFAAVTTITAEECQELFNRDRDLLLAQYKRATETALVQADFMNSMEIVTLQALVIYVTTIRTHDKSRTGWALVGLMMRIAHGLGLHRDGNGEAFSAFEAEIRRRLWWMVLILDMRASEDRCTEPAILQSSFNTRMPCNIDDEDFDFDSPHPLPDKKGFTAMSSCLICMDVTNTVRKINFIPSLDERYTMTFQEKTDLVKECCGRIEDHYLYKCDPDDNSWIAFMLGRLLSLKLWLVIQYPMQSREHNAREVFSKGQALRTAVAYLELCELLEKRPAAQGIKWFLTTYVPWHALAVALVELCTETEGVVVEKAWTIIEEGFQRWASRVADSKDGLLWRPIKNLYKRAQAARDKAKNKSIVQHRVTVPPPQLYEPISHGELAQNMPRLSIGETQVNPNARTMFPDLNQPQNFASPSPFDFSFSQDIQPPNMAANMDAVDWNNWNQFLTDTTIAEPESRLSFLLTEEPPQGYQNMNMSM